MDRRKLHSFLPILLGALLMIAALILLWPAPRASAQCGSQASSCKTCHETNNEKSVNNDGTGWHTGHAFADFCYACHGGNSQSMNKDESHAGMVPPMQDIKTACQSCHPNDLMERAQKYATILGVDLSTAGSAPAPATTAAAPVSGGTEATPAAPAAATTGGGVPSAPASSGEIVTGGSGEVIDYVARYAGKTPVNWGNVILAVLIVLVGAGGGAFVYFNERKLRGLPLVKASTAKPAVAELPKVEGYTDDVVALLPKIAALNPVGRHALARLLENPDEAAELLHSLSRLDPELVKRIRSLDRDSRALLLALSGD
jgi:hypothetical protein